MLFFGVLPRLRYKHGKNVHFQQAAFSMNMIEKVHCLSRQIYRSYTGEVDAQVVCAVSTPQPHGSRHVKPALCQAYISHPPPVSSPPGGQGGKSSMVTTTAHAWLKSDHPLLPKKGSIPNQPPTRKFSRCSPGHICWRIPSPCPPHQRCPAPPAWCPQVQLSHLQINNPSRDPVLGHWRDDQLNAAFFILSDQHHWWFEQQADTQQWDLNAPSPHLKFTPKEKNFFCDKFDQSTHRRWPRILGPRLRRGATDLRARRPPASSHHPRRSWASHHRTCHEEPLRQSPVQQQCRRTTKVSHPCLRRRQCFAALLFAAWTKPRLWDWPPCPQTSAQT